MEIRFTSEEARARWEEAHRDELFDAPAIEQRPRPDDEEEGIELRSYAYDAW